MECTWYSAVHSLSIIQHYIQIHVQMYMPCMQCGQQYMSMENWFIFNTCRRRQQGRWQRQRRRQWRRCVNILDFHAFGQQNNYPDCNALIRIIWFQGQMRYAGMLRYSIFNSRNEEATTPKANEYWNHVASNKMFLRWYICNFYPFMQGSESDANILGFVISVELLVDDSGGIAICLQGTHCSTTIIAINSTLDFAVSTSIEFACR